MKLGRQTRGAIAATLLLTAPLAAAAELAPLADPPANLVAQAPSGRVVAPRSNAAASRTTTTGARPPAGAGTVYVKRAGTELRSTATPAGAVVAKLAEGAPLTVLGTEGSRLRVRTAAGQEGYVTKLNVADTAPSTRGGSGLGFRNDVAMGERSNVMSTRGLAPEAEQYAASADVTPEAKADLERMKQIAGSITETDLEKFLDEGEVIPQ